MKKVGFKFIWNDLENWQESIFNNGNLGKCIRYRRHRSLVCELDLMIGYKVYMLWYEMH